MKELINVTFEAGSLPEGWIVPNPCYRFERGGLRSGNSSSPRLILPGGNWQRLRVEIDVEPITGAAVSCGDGTLNTVVDLKRGTHRISFYGPEALTRTRKPITPLQDRYAVSFDYDRGRISASVDGIEVITANDPRPGPVGGLVTLGFHEDCLVQRVRILADEPVEVAPGLSKPAGDEFELQVTVDFIDDLIAAPFSESMLDQLFAEFKSWGVRRCQWIYYGTRADGWWDHTGGERTAGNTTLTLDRVGEIFPAAVRAAHAHGIEVHALLKPFDMGFYYSYGDGTPEAKSRGKLPRIGGPKTSIANFPAQHRELIMARKPAVSGPALNRSFTRIELVKEDAEPAGFTIDDLRLYVSDDNVTYRLYAGPISRQEVAEDYPVWEHTSSGGRATGEKRRSRVMRLSDLLIDQPYLAIAVEGRGGSFANSLVNLVHVFGELGEERRLTYGLVTRRMEHLTGERIPTDFRQHGIEFDVNPGTPSAVQPGYDPIRAARALDSGDGFLAIARGKETGPIAALSPSFPQARAFWLSWLRDALDAGADGIELRVRAHNYNLTWAEFGFEAPVVEAFARRYGVDLLATDDFDRAAWRRLRGEGYTRFLREARALAKSYGKPMGLHVSPTLEMDPEQGAAMEIHWDWRTWLDEGLADSVTLKEVWPGSRLARQVMAHARPRGTRLIFSPFALNLGNTPGGEQTVADWIRLARRQGCDGYQFYECCSIVRAAPDGQLVMTQPALKAVFQREFRSCGTDRRT